MALSIRSAAVEKMARELARRRGIGMTEVISEALASRLDAEGKAERALRDRLSAIARESCGAPDLEAASEDEMLGYDDRGGFGNGRR